MRSQWSRRHALGAGLLISGDGHAGASRSLAADGTVAMGAPEPFSFERLIVQAKESGAKGLSTTCRGPAVAV